MPVYSLSTWAPYPRSLTTGKSTAGPRCTNSAIILSVSMRNTASASVSFCVLPQASEVVMSAPAQHGKTSPFGEIVRLSTRSQQPFSRINISRNLGRSATAYRMHAAVADQHMHEIARLEIA
jgi:hypothetical protein